MDNGFNTEETITTSNSDGSTENNVGGETADSKEVVSVHEFLSKELGKDFKDDETAVKSIKDTFKYVGKVGKLIPIMENLQAKYGSESRAIQELTNMISGEQPNNNSSFVSKDEYEKDMFFSKNPVHEQNREIIDALKIKYPEKSLQEIVELPAYKTVFEKISAYDKSEKSKSVLVSNPRLGQATDKISKARESIKSGNMVEAQQNAVSAVLDAFE